MEECRDYLHTGGLRVQSMVGPLTECPEQIYIKRLMVCNVKGKSVHLKAKESDAEAEESVLRARI